MLEFRLPIDVGSLQSMMRCKDSSRTMCSRGHHLARRNSHRVLTPEALFATKTGIWPVHLCYIEKLLYVFVSFQWMMYLRRLRLRCWKRQRQWLTSTDDYCWWKQRYEGTWRYEYAWLCNIVSKVTLLPLQRSFPSSEMVMIDRTFNQEERSNLTQDKRMLLVDPGKNQTRTSLHLEE